jgi:putative tricarboxylic transport membrane protein
MQITKSISADRAAALVLIVAFSAYGLYGSRLESSLGVDFVGPDFFPKAIGICGVGLAIVLLVQDHIRTRANAADASKDGGASPGWFDVTVAIPFAMMLAYVLSLEYLGFPIASALFLVFTARILGCPSWIWSIVFGVLSTAAVVFLFRYGFTLRLPQGVLIRLW